MNFILQWLRECDYSGRPWRRFQFGMFFPSFHVDSWTATWHFLWRPRRRFIHPIDCSFSCIFCFIGRRRAIIKWWRTWEERPDNVARNVCAFITRLLVVSAAVFFQFSGWSRKWIWPFREHLRRIVWQANRYRGSCTGGFVVSGWLSSISRRDRAEKCSYRQYEG